MLLKICNMQKICSFYLMRNKDIIIITIIRKIESYTYIDLEIIQIKDNIYSIELKPREIVTFLCFTWKITHKWALKILATRFTFIVERSKKNLYFHTKMARPPDTYDVISRNHSNWPSLNLSQNVREGWTNRYWKRQVLMFYPLGKKTQRNPGGIHPLPSPLYVQRLTGP